MPQHVALRGSRAPIAEAMVKLREGGLWRVGCALVALNVALSSSAAEVEHTADPELIPEARRVLEYLREVQGKGILTGVSDVGGGGGGPQNVLHRTGREPAIMYGNMSGYHPLEPELQRRVLQAVTDACLSWWREKGGIVHLHYHWCWVRTGKPPKASFMRSPDPPDLEKMRTPGTDEHRAFRHYLGVAADYLQKLAEARVPVLWAPFHEIDGGWFWWTDAAKPENTAALWREMFNCLVKERKLHNLIWVFQPAHVAHAAGKGFEENMAYRRRFYPGSEYVDIASISVYGDRKYREQGWWGSPWEESYARAYELMQGIAPGKMLAVGEAPSLLNPIIAKREGPPWVWCLAWYVDQPEWDRFTWNHPYFITLDRLPLLAEGNVKPNVRITEPADGAEARGQQLHILGVATDRNANLKSVSVHSLKAPWLTWHQREDRAVHAAFGGETHLGDAELEPGGRWSFTWRNPPAGHHNLVALARDAGGAVACSNVARITTGLENLARGKTATASSAQHPPEGAVDGDLHTAWWADKSAPDPQWLQVDLGTQRTVGAVAVLWWKAHAKAYAVQVSDDGQKWREVADVKNRVSSGPHSQTWLGDSDVIRFQPIRARHLRLHLRERAVNWHSYVVSDLGVYERVPEQE